MQYMVTFDAVLETNFDSTHHGGEGLTKLTYLV